MEKDRKSIPQDTVDATPRDTTGRESVPTTREEEGQSGRQASCGGTDDEFEERVRRDCRRTCRRNLFVELLKTVAKVAGVILAAMGATYSSNCSKLLPRSQVLYSLQWDCRRSTRKINLLVLHCSDTRPDQDFTIEKLMHSHRAKGYGSYPGYHLYVRRDGTLFYCRPVAERGCHVKGYNTNSIGICYEGGHSCSPEAKYEDNRTAEQMVALDEVLRILHEIYPEARIVGHCELNPRKACPCLNPPASEEYRYISDPL